MKNDQPAYSDKATEASVLGDLAGIVPEATRLVATIVDLNQLDQLKSRYLGKQGLLTQKLKNLGSLSPELKSNYGKELNELKTRIFQLFNQKEQELKQRALNTALQAEHIDISLPPRGVPKGSLHPISQIRRKLAGFFSRMGFTVLDGPEIEDDFHNFSALNIPPLHPARSKHDTFYLNDQNLSLRSQTSSVQVRALENLKLPLNIVCPGRVFRRDNDATHSPMFHQMEMLMVNQTVTMANLRWLIFNFVTYLFGPDAQCRFRPSYFPFTEPSAEVDIRWQGQKWLELGGCGVVHPNVLNTLNIDSSKYRGLAFGFGLDRLAMVYYGINDIRRLYENDIDFLSQF